MGKAGNPDPCNGGGKGGGGGRAGNRSVSGVEVEGG